jgi:murein DD-endopeptidase MepM/ murein hydrolase activator NlpD
MSSRDDDDVSFDPKSWGTRSSSASDTDAEAASPKPDNARSEDPGFDIRQWGSGMPPPPPPGTPDTSHRAIKPIVVTGLFAAGLAATILAFAGGGEAPPPQPSAQAPRSAAPHTPRGANRRTLLIGGPEDVSGTLSAAGVSADVADQLSQRVLDAMPPDGREIRLVLDLLPGRPPRLARLEATRQDGSGLILTAGGGGAFTQTRLETRLEARIQVIRGEMDSESFYSSAVAAGVIDSLISDFANAFSYDFDMQREVAPGDVFEAAFEQAYNPSGRPVGVPRLLYVSLSTPKKSRALYRFTPPGETEPGWFDGNGSSTVRALMRTPVDSARISSQFGMRTHPILGYQKLHRGTDFAAPIGTPIYASGNATVEWAAMKGANGNLTILRHENGWQTYYLHQNMFMPGVTAGARVNQGQKIGEIGTTGRSTGPHLHYEVHIAGQPVDPLSIETGTTGKTLDGAALEAFRAERDRVDARRAQSDG